MNFPLFLIPVFVGLITQAIKPIFNKEWYAQMEVRGHKIPRYGGMPSAHSATAFSIVTVVGVIDGIYTTTFLMAVVLMIWTIDDALRMRMFLGRYGAALRQLIAKLPASEQRQFPYLEARLGHKGPEVVAGALIGIILTLVILFFFNQHALGF